MITKNDVSSKVLKVLYDEPSLVLALKEKYINDSIWRFCIEREPGLFKKMKHPSQKICEFAVEINGKNLKYVVKRFKYIQITEKMMLDAIKSYPRALLYVPSKFQTDGLKEFAFDRDPSLMLEFDNVRHDYIERKIMEDPYFLKFVKNADENMICNVLKKNPNMIAYVENLTPAIIVFMKENFPDILEMYNRNAQETINKGERESCQN